MKLDLLLVPGLCLWCFIMQGLLEPFPPLNELLMWTVRICIALTFGFSLFRARSHTVLALGVGYSAVFGRHRVQQHLCAFLLLRWVGQLWNWILGLIPSSQSLWPLVFEGGGLIAVLFVGWLVVLAAISVVKRPLHSLSTSSLLVLLSLLTSLAVGSWMLSTLLRQALTSLLFHLCSGTTPIFSLLAILSLPRRSVPTAALISVIVSAALAWWWFAPKSLGRFLCEAISFVRIVSGLFMNVVLFALLRTQHPMRYRVLLLNMSTCAGMVVSGVLPSIVELGRCLRSVLRVILCLLSAPGMCWNYDRDLHAVLVAAVVPFLIASYATWRTSVALTRASNPASAQPRIELNFKALPSDDKKEPADPSNSNMLRVRMLRDRLPARVRDWMKDHTTTPSTQVLGGFAACMLWELLAAKCAKDVAAILQALSPASVAWHVRRAHILEDGLACLNRLAASRLHSKVLKVSFVEEMGQDVGGVSCDFFTQFAAAAAKTLFVTDSNGSHLPSSTVCTDTLETPFSAIGRFLGLCVMQGHVVDLPLCPIAYKLMVGQPATVEDVHAVDPIFFRNYFEVLMQEDGIEQMEAIICEPIYFVSAATPMFPDQIPLHPGGEMKRVTTANKQEYLSLLAEHYLMGNSKAHLLELIAGFHEVIPLSVLQQLNVSPDELRLLLNGAQDLNVDDWRLHTEVEALNAERQAVVEWFWDIAHHMTQCERAKLLMFITGRARLPLEGFRGLQCLITFDKDPAHLPSAHTCTNNLVLPVYRTREDLHHGLHLILGNDMTLGFGLA